MVTGRPYAESELSVLSRARQLHDVTRGRRAPSYLVSPTCSAIGASRALPPFAHSSHLSLLPPSPNSPHNDPAKYSLFAAASHRIRSLEVPHTLISKVIIIIFQRGAIARILVSLSLSHPPLCCHPLFSSCRIRVPPMLPLRDRSRLPFLCLLRDTVSRFFSSSLVDFNLQRSVPVTLYLATAISIWTGHDFPRRPGSPKRGRRRFTECHVYDATSVPE